MRFHNLAGWETATPCILIAAEPVTEPIRRSRDQRGQAMAHWNLVVGSEWLVVTRQLGDGEQVQAVARGAGTATPIWTKVTKLPRNTMQIEGADLAGDSSDSAWP